jgi:hypothetical protein
VVAHHEHAEAEDHRRRRFRNHAARPLGDHPAILRAERSAVGDPCGRVEPVSLDVEDDGETAAPSRGWLAI